MWLVIFCLWWTSAFEKKGESPSKVKGTVRYFRYIFLVSLVYLLSKPFGKLWSAMNLEEQKQMIFLHKLSQATYWRYELCLNSIYLIYGYSHVQDVRIASSILSQAVIIRFLKRNEEDIMSVFILCLLVVLKSKL